MTSDPTHQYSRLDELVAKGDGLTEPEWIEFEHLAYLLADAGYQAHRRTLPWSARSPHRSRAHDAT
jgi:hypothetical protein